MSDAARRTFYDEYSWAYYLLIPPPSEGQLDFNADAFARLSRAGFGRVDFFGAYEPARPAGTNDRLVRVADKLT